MCITGCIARAAQVASIIGVLSAVGCATSKYKPLARPEPTVAELSETESRAAQVALNRMAYSSDLDTARVARQMVAAHAGE
jgi:hypothetical protein